MKSPAKSKSSRARQSKSSYKTSDNNQNFVSEYSKYFVAPVSTPDAFRIFDSSEGSEISYSSHT